MLHISNVHKSFAERQVLRGVCLDVPAGTVTVLCGSSGAGKTTLLRCANGLERPEDGSIVIDGITVEANGRLRELRSRIGMVFQEDSLYPHLSALQNVALAPIHVQRLSVREANEKARGYLAQVGLQDRANDYPAKLSGGQKQRVALARALVMEPRVLLLDEPTSFLDPENKGGFLDTMSALADEGRTMLIATHELLFARQIATEFALLAEGRIVEVASPNDFLKYPKCDHARKFLKRPPTVEF